MYLSMCMCFFSILSFFYFMQVINWGHQIMAKYWCCVTDCSNSSKKLKKWKLTYCELHKCPSGAVDYGCSCPPPFTFHAFPTERADPEGRRRWINRINRIDEKTNTQWVPKPYNRVCSDHFVDKKPTQENPWPSLKLGYQPPSVARVARRPPRDRQSLVRPREEDSDDDQIDYADIPPSPPQPPPVPEDVTLKIALQEHDYTTCRCLPNCSCSEAAEEIRKIQKENEDLKLKKKPLSYTDLDDKAIKTYTGLQD